MAEINWWQIGIAAGAALLGGGVMGAFLNNHFAKKRSRVQPVHYRIGTDTRTGLVGPKNEYVLSISVKHGEKVYEYPHLTIVRIQIANVGENDHAEFPFGFTLADGDTAIMCDVENPDRHNVINAVSPPTPANPLNAVDFVCKPFNRAKEYGIALYVLPGKGAEQCGEITPSSPVSANFIRTGSFLILTRDETEFIFESLFRSLPFGWSIYELSKRIRARRSGK